jgi:hypothetical protein
LFENAESEEVSSMVKKAKAAVKKLTWERAAGEVIEFVKKSEAFSGLKQKKFA